MSESLRLPLADAAAGRALFVVGVATKIRKLVRGQTADERLMNRRRTEFYVSVWTEAARSLSLPVRALNGSLLEIGAGAGRLLVQRNTTSLDDPLTVSITEDKALVHRLLGARGIPTPRHLACRFDELDRAWRFVTGTGGTFVVKPRLHGIGGLGVTTGVRTRMELARAMGYARGVEADLMIEEQIEGDVYRLLYFDGELLDAVLRRPASVVGDGGSTIRRLVEKDNADRVQGGIEVAQEVLRVDRDLAQSLSDQGYGLASVPPAGQSVRLKRVANDNRRRDNLPARDRLCADVIAAGREAADAIGLRLAGVDVITTDPEVSLAASGGVVLEVNHGPGLYYHYMTTGQSTPVATMILERLSAVRHAGRGEAGGRG